jgi:hypothetical protein
MRVFKKAAVLFSATFVFVLLFAAVANASPSGAIFTTMPYGEAVNANTQYTAKEQVFLNGGPGPNAPTWAAGLPDGEYYFMVTDPSGKVLLSTDSLSKRKFTVVGGLIVSADNHLWQPDTYRGAGGVVQLIPFDDTPNPGGVYKAWATPVDKYDPNGNGNKWGFVPAWSKTDNFKIKSSNPCFCLDISKFKDECWDGAFNAGIDQCITGWPVKIVETLPDGQVTCWDLNTPVKCFEMVPGATYVVSEMSLDGWWLTGVYVNGEAVAGPDVTIVAPDAAAAPVAKGKKAQVPANTSCVATSVLFGNGCCEYTCVDPGDCCVYCGDCSTGTCMDPGCTCEYCIN